VSARPRLFRMGGLIAGVGLGASLLFTVPAAGIVGLTLLGVGTSFLLPLAVKSAGNLEGGTRPWPGWRRSGAWARLPVRP
jgi:hypothetical protein